MARTPIHPGEILQDELSELGLTASELGFILHLPAKRITQVLNGQQDITSDLALCLGEWLGTGATFWLNLQKSYDLRLAMNKLTTDN
jgi:antitoxin HigA-1